MTTFRLIQVNNETFSSFISAKPIDCISVAINNEVNDLGE